MGIDCERFTDKSEVITTFTCPICLDIVLDPVATSCCSQSFCKSCLTSWFKIRAACPHCNTTTNKMNRIHRQVQELYLNLSMKCVAEKCKVSLTPANYIAHDNSCVFIPFNCKICGFKSNIGQKDGHHCGNWLLGQRKKLMACVNKWQTDPRMRTKVQGQLLDGVTFDLCEVVETKIKLAEDQIKIAEEKIKIQEDKIEKAEEKIKIGEDKIKIAEDKIKKAENKIKLAEDKIKKAENKIKIEEKKSKWLKFALFFVVMLIIVLFSLLLSFVGETKRDKLQITFFKSRAVTLTVQNIVCKNTLTKLLEGHNATASNNVTEPTM